MFISIVGFSQDKKSFFYEVSKVGSPNSYLYGTMHLPSYKTLQIPDTLFKMCEDLDVYVFEVLPDSTTISNAQAIKSELRKTNRFKDKATPVQFHKVKNLLNAHFKADINKYDTLTPNEISSYLTGFKKTAQYTPDELLYLFAKKTKKQLIPLEDAAVLYKIQMSYDCYNLEADCDNFKPTNNLTSKSLNAYYKGDLATFYQMTQRSAKRHAKYHDALITQRNQFFNTQVLALLLQNKSILVTVGLGHYVGEDGMISYLKKQGYAVKRITSKSQVGTKARIVSQLTDAFSGDEMKDLVLNLTGHAKFGKLILEEKYDSTLYYTRGKTDEISQLYTAQAYEGKENLEKALMAITETIKIKDNGEYRYLKAGYLYLSDKYEKAITEYQHILVHFPDYDSSAVLWDIAQAYFFMNDPLLASEHYIKYYDKTNDEEALVYVGYCKIQQDKHDEALKILLSVANEKFKDAAYYYYLGKIYTAQAEWEKSLLELIKANELGHGYYNHEVALAYFNTNNYQKTIEFCTKTIASSPSEADEARFYRALSYSQLENKAEAKKDMLAYSEVFPDFSPANYFLSSIYRDEKDLVNALFYVNKALSGAQDFQNFYLKGLVLFEMDKYTEAIEPFQQAKILKPEHGDIYYYIGVCHFRLKDNETACALFKKAKALGTTDIDQLILKVCK